MGPHYSQHTNTYLLLEKCNVADVEMGETCDKEQKQNGKNCCNCYVISFFFICKQNYFTLKHNIF